MSTLPRISPSPVLSKLTVVFWHFCVNNGVKATTHNSIIVTLLGLSAVRPHVGTLAPNSYISRPESPHFLHDPTFRRVMSHPRGNPPSRTPTPTDKYTIYLPPILPPPTFTRLSPFSAPPSPGMREAMARPVPPLSLGQIPQIPTFQTIRPIAHATPTPTYAPHARHHHTLNSRALQQTLSQQEMPPPWGVAFSKSQDGVASSSDTEGVACSGKKRRR
ncbi:hypothetical protein MIND_00903500 [Mycena indigotica]|uniref:Uncharacterized protein n=1 Tax=Mycena indigotica TaxID=2126181 RepID=A0A8H6SJ11_9AGAR|nr:uncharacterized protein MIND_00903500 [Mycena indigotica]KAF7299531.1 hypothetical protein MIND_00903500 [Mycena indigotica]